MQARKETLARHIHPWMSCAYMWLTMLILRNISAKRNTNTSPRRLDMRWEESRWVGWREWRFYVH